MKKKTNPTPPVSNRWYHHTSLEDAIRSITSEQHPGPKMLLTEREACAVLDVTPNRLRELTERGAIRPIKALSTLLYPYSELVKFVEEAK